MTEHKFADVFRAIASGVPVNEFEGWYIKNPTCVEGLSEFLSSLATWPEYWEVRRKQQYIVVNGFKVPKPLDAKPEKPTNFFVPMVSDDVFLFTNTRSDSIWFDVMFKRGIAHATKEAAIAHAKAMLGIDPNAA